MIMYCIQPKCQSGPEYLDCALFQCPVFDSEENVQYGNYYQTMTYQAGITVRVSVVDLFDKL